MAAHRVRALLMGGQACVFYGAAEFSRDTDLLQRLLEAHYLQHRAAPTPAQQRFWLLELRTPELLIEAVRSWPGLAAELSNQRPLLHLAESGTLSQLSEALGAEQSAEQERDRAYWQPIKTELEQLRHAARRR